MKHGDSLLIDRVLHAAAPPANLIECLRFCSLVIEPGDGHRGYDRMTSWSTSVKVASLNGSVRTDG